jgi:aryl-alcohol dehydrogenase-like predicted oxidoreductase
MQLSPTVQLTRSIEETKVEYAQLGSSGLRVSVPILGAMLLNNTFIEYGVDEESSLKILKAAYDIGMTSWDTANAYGNGLSEIVIGKAIQKFELPRQKLVIMTKIWGFVGEEPELAPFVHTAAMATSKDYVNQGGS